MLVSYKMDFTPDMVVLAKLNPHGGLRVAVFT